MDLSGLKHFVFAPRTLSYLSGPGLMNPLIKISRHVVLAPLIAALLVVSCSRPASSYLEAARRAETEARLAFERHDPEAAGLAASRAEVALADVERLKTSGKVVPADSLLRDTRAAAISARDYAQLALEESQRLKKLAALQIKVYQNVRGTVFSYGLTGLATAADQLARFGSNSSSSAEQQIAAFGRSLIEALDSHLPSDWAGIAANLRDWATNPPPALGMVLALGLSSGAMTDFALCEIESIDASKLTATNLLSYYHLERGALFAWNGWDRSAARELESAMKLSTNGWHGVGADQALAIFHFWLADQSLQRGHHAQAEVEIEKARLAWPDSPLVDLLAGEKLAANGQWQRAVDLLETQARSTKNEWLAQCMTHRARELRESQGKAPALFSDPKFILDLVAHLAGDKAHESPAGNKFQQFLNGAKAFGDRVAEKLPGMGGKQ
jgi:hypothetical protein